MGKLCLVIADKDENYLERLGDYLMINYSGRFNIHLFSSRENLSRFLNSSGRRPDILLISSEISDGFLVSGQAQAIVELSDNDIPAVNESIHRVYKYRHTEGLVKDILHIYSKSGYDTFALEGKKPGAIYAVHSASGGAGCTSIAVCLSMLAARRSLKPLYISLEGTPSTSFYFRGQWDRTFSDVLYYLKDGGTNLAVKLESACCCDAASGVHFIPPPDSISELEELSAEDIELLVKTLRTSSIFDVVFIDLPSGLSRRNSLIFKYCDRIVNVSPYEGFSLFKKAFMEKDPGFREAGTAEDLFSKIIHVLNRYREFQPYGFNESDYSDVFGITIKESDMFGVKQGGEILTDMDPVFTAAVVKLLDLLTAGDGSDSMFNGGKAHA